MQPPAALTLADLPDAALQRVVDLSDAWDLFVLRQVSRRFRYAVDGRIRRLAPCRDAPIPSDLETRFARLIVLDLTHQSASLDLAAVLSQLPRLRGLALSVGTWPPASSEGGAWPPASSEALQSLRGLTSLRVKFAFSDDAAVTATLSAVGRCRSLQRLQLHEYSCLPWPAFTAAVSQLAASLTELDISLSFYDEEEPALDLAAINTGRLKALRLTLHYYGEDDLYLSMPTGMGSQLAALTSLQELDVSDSSALNEEAAHISALTGLTRLDLSGTNVSSAAVAQMSTLPRLADLGYTTDGWDEPGDAQVHSFPATLSGFSKRLTRLDVSGCWHDGEGLPLGALAQLTYLSADLTSIPRAHGALGTLPALRELSLSGQYSHESQLSRLSGATALTRLDWRRCTLSHDGPWPDKTAVLCWVATLTSLRQLRIDFDRSRADCAAWDQLTSLTAVRVLRLSVPNPPAVQLLLAQLQLDWLHVTGSLGLTVPACQLPPGVRAAAMRGARCQAHPYFESSKALF